MSQGSLDGVWESGGLNDEDFLAIDITSVSSNSACPSTSSCNTTPDTSPIKHPGNHFINSPATTPTKSKFENISNNILWSPSCATSPSTSLRKAQRKRLTYGTPLQCYRFGRIWVTDIMSQMWCEQQLVYNFDPPEMLDVEVVEAPEIQIGANMHLARELEIKDIITVKITSAEDRFALKIINLMDSLTAMLELGTPVAREIPVFGMPFDMGVFIIGTIDEIRCNQDNLQMDMYEFKTRATNNLPGEAQTRQHNLQLMLYKKLFDDLVEMKITKEAIAKHMRLNLTVALGNAIIEQLFLRNKKFVTLDRLLSNLFEIIQAVPFITSLKIEYAFQQDNSCMAIKDVKYDEGWLRAKLENAFQFWKGQRTPVGVDIEDVWKCNRCQYSQVCSWRSNLAKEISKGMNNVSERGGDASIISHPESVVAGTTLGKINTNDGKLDNESDNDAPCLKNQ